ncbi:MAG TPA: CarD family transcriptional regulator [Candidatus Avacidaminococcus intestinavium]|uniref:CarD family transcriptional regulator n=1 Tax=Candidatus Avacidaminococcus intestinavium TaxID=2840684 RepID=A0A9D1MPD8_9FIRM|nr:CarD family transcriptional regulator [Candidatus Avacidaminococcus intestinavium]
MFETGDKVVYPMHGAGMVHSIEKRKNADGTLVEYFILEMLLGDMRIMIPVENVEQVGLRHVINEQELKELEKILTSRPENEMKSITWNRRFNLYLDKMKSGDSFEVACVVRTLAVQEEEKKLSTGERRLLNMAKQILLSEIMLVRSQKLEEADEWLNKFFQ